MSPQDHANAHALFAELKRVLISLEDEGLRPMVTTHGNGMLDTLIIAEGHATTPFIERIRRKNALAAAHAAC